MQIDSGYIENLLRTAADASDRDVEGALDKAARFEGLSHREVAALLMAKSPAYRERLFHTAGQIKQDIYGNRIVIFAPLYVSDYCVNQCAYCGYNCRRSFARHRLTMDELREEVRALEAMGHKRLALEAGEDDARCPIDYILECIRTIYAMKADKGEIRRVNVNIAATTQENYQKLKEVGIGTYILFQETYHQPTYERMHTAGPKADYAYHLNAFDRTMRAGIDDVGGGVLFGLHDPYFEVIALMLHNEHLEKEFGVGFHTISVPRLCRAEGMDMSAFPHLVDDATFEKLVAVIRLAVPYTGMILSTRENRAMREKLLKAGISQLSAGSSTEVGGYQKRSRSGAQFAVNDERSALDILKDLMKDGYIPSFCTACYRSGRTGDRFMSLAKSGEIKNVCLPNALLTLLEYVEDYGDEEFRACAEDVFARELAHIENETVRKLTGEQMETMRAGKRDLFL